MQWAGGLLLDVADDPLTLQTTAGDRVARIVDSRTTTRLQAAVGLMDRFEVGASLPIVVQNLEDDLADYGLGGGPKGAVALGDLRLMIRAVLHEDDPASHRGLSVAVALNAYLPIGQEDAFASEPLRIEPRLAADFGLPQGTLNANLGYRFRSATRAFGNVVVDDLLTFGFAADLPLGGRRRSCRSWRAA
ncbi:MAG: hypothetical protein R3F43_27235 [bacterium]